MHKFEIHHPQKLPISDEALNIRAEFIHTDYLATYKLKSKVLLVADGDSEIRHFSKIQFTKQGAHVAIAHLNTDIGKKDAAYIDYSATQSRVISFASALSNQISSKNIYANIVSLGSVWMPLKLAIQRQFDPKRIENFDSETTIRRCSQSYELDPMCIFLAKQDASFILSQKIHPNGNMMVSS